MMTNRRRRQACKKREEYILLARAFASEIETDNHLHISDAGKQFLTSRFRIFKMDNRYFDIVEYLAAGSKGSQRQAFQINRKRERG